MYVLLLFIYYCKLPHIMLTIEQKNRHETDTAIWMS